VLIVVLAVVLAVVLIVVFVVAASVFLRVGRSAASRVSRRFLFVVLVVVFWSSC
jgi:hypothetical protein